MIEMKEEARSDRPARSVSRRILWPMALAAVLGSALSIGALLLVRRVTPDFVAARASAALGRTVTVASVGVAFRPGPRIRTGAISVASGPTARAAELQPAWWSLLRGDPRLRAVRLDGAMLTLTRNRDGGVEVRGLEHLTQSGGSRPPTPTTTMPVAALPSIELVDADLTWIDHALRARPVTMRIALKRARVRGVREGASARFEIQGGLAVAKRRGDFVLSGTAGPLREAASLGSQPVAVQLKTQDVEAAWLVPYLPASWNISRAEGPLDAEISLHQSDTGELEGRLQISLGAGFVDFNAFRFAGPGTFESGLRWADDALVLSDAKLATAGATRYDRHVEQLESRFAYRNETLTLESLQAQAYGGRLTHQGKYQFGAQTLLDLELTLSGASLAQLVGATGPELPASPMVDAQAQISGPVDEPRKLRGSGTFTAHGGEVLFAGLSESVGDALTGFVPKWARRRKPKPPPTRTRLHRAAFPFTLEGGRAQTDALEIITDDYRIRGRGDVDVVDRTLDLEIDVAFTAQGIEQVVSYAASAAHLRASRQLPSIPVHVSGPLDDVRFQPKLGAAPMASLAGLLWGAGAAVDLTEAATREAADVVEGRFGESSDGSR